MARTQSKLIGYQKLWHVHFVYLKDEPVMEVNEKANRTLLVTAIASLLIAIAATVSEESFRGHMLALASGLIFYSFPLIHPMLGIVGIRNGNKENGTSGRGSGTYTTLFRSVAFVVLLFPLVSVYVIER